jgi:hypothetical protein
MRPIAPSPTLPRPSAGGALNYLSLAMREKALISLARFAGEGRGGGAV